MSLPPIVAKITADTSGLDKGIEGAKSKLGMFSKAGLAAGAAVGTLAVGMVALTRASMDNIDAQAKQARSLGLTVSAFQKMTLVANEAGVETGKLTAMLGLMQRNIEGLVQGTAAQTEAFGRLGLAVADLQGLTADEQFAKIAAALDGIEDPAQKTALAMDVFGRSGREAINMLSGYSDAVANAAEFNARFGISVSQATADGVERANDAVGRLGMVFEGLGNRMAGFVAGPLEATANGLLRIAEAIFGVRANVEEFFGSLEAAKAALGEDIFNRMMGSPEDVAASGQALSDLAYRMDEFKWLGFETGAAIQELHATVYRLDEVAASAFDGILMRQEQLRQQLQDGTIDAETFATKMGELGDQALDLARYLEEVNGVSFGPVIGALASLGETIRGRIAEALQLRSTLAGAMDVYGMTEGTGLSGADGNMPPTFDSGMTSSQRPKEAPSGIGGIDWGDAGGGGGGGGGGLKSQLEQRLQTLMEGLQTEAEAVATWYAEQQATLEEALAAKMLTEAEYMEQRERLEKEHQDRLSGIRQTANESNLSMVLGAGQEILSAIGQNNKKAMKVAKVFGAAQALISTYQGAAEALKLPFPKNLAAAAAVIAKGIGFVNAIKSVNEGGGGGGGGGGGSAAATQSAPPVQRMLIDYRGPESAFPSFSALVDMMNQAGKAGYVLNAQITGRG